MRGIHRRHAFRLDRVALPEVPWDELDAHRSRSIYQTRAWLDFLVETQRAEPVVARLHHRETAIGWFTGAIVRRLGVRMLGSPLPGWTTSYMGFTLDQPVDPADLLTAGRRFAFGELRCHHFELMDRSVPMSASIPRGVRRDQFTGYQLELGTDDAMLSRMTKGGRRDVRRALRNGVVVEEVSATDAYGFAGEYFRQVEAAFSKRNLRPTFRIERVHAAIRHVHPTGRMLLLRALTDGGHPAATGIFLGLPGGTATFWMGASERSAQHLLPNEALMWHAIRTWRDRGAVRFDFGGGGRHKAKYGGQPIEVPWFRCDRLIGLEWGRGLARRAVRLRQATPD